MSLCYRVAFNERVTTLKQQKRSGREREKLKQKDNLRSSEKKNSRNEYFKRSCKRRTEKKTREKNNEKNKKKKWKIKRAIVSQYFTHACTISSSCWLTKFNVVFFILFFISVFLKSEKWTKQRTKRTNGYLKFIEFGGEASGETYVWNFQLNWNRTRDRCVAW